MGAARDATRPISVLVVDDDPEIVETSVAILSLRGFRAAGALGGREAVSAALASTPDVALVDLAMPDVDGFEVARRLRAMDVPPVLVAVTGLGSDWDRQRAYEAGFVLYLPHEAGAARGVGRGRPGLRAGPRLGVRPMGLGARVRAAQCAPVARRPPRAAQWVKSWRTPGPLRSQ
jgi:CheY-like chemotaxis protein